MKTARETLKQFVASGLVIREDRTILLVRHRKLKSWVYPGGHVKWYETPDDAVVREVFEETGIRVRLLDTRGPSLALDKDELLNLPYMILSERIEFRPEPRHDHIDLVYLCSAVLEDKHKTPVHNPSEVLEARFVGADETKGLEMMSDVRQILLSVFDDARVWTRILGD